MATNTERAICTCPRPDPVTRAIREVAGGSPVLLVRRLRLSIFPACPQQRPRTAPHSPLRKLDPKEIARC